jgi:hypothetical protein
MKSAKSGKNKKQNDTARMSKSLPLLVANAVIVRPLVLKIFATISGSVVLFVGV